MIPLNIQQTQLRLSNEPCSKFEIYRPKYKELICHYVKVTLESSIKRRERRKLVQ